MSRDFTKLEDEQMIRLIREENNEEAMDFLMNKKRGQNFIYDGSRFRGYYSRRNDRSF